ncbi:MAG TPA: dihydrofolate reductase [Ferruginibacter sp.]|jgi:dihydrofolate reductase|nr:dihydrofolate reductase [Ferruginibacter sp.]
MTISLVVAAAENNSIGKHNQLPWHLPNDLKFFKNTTWAMPVIMGRKTYESVNKPLPGRFNIVITRQIDWSAEGVKTAGGLQDALRKASETNCKEAFIIGGGEIFNQGMEIADRIYMTRVHADVEGDTFFPAIDAHKWEMVFNRDLPADDKHAFAYSFQTWERIRN